MSNIELLPKYTYSDYELWEGDWELIEGIPVSMAPAPMRIHQNIATQILTAMQNSFDEEKCPECYVSFENDWKISNDTVLRPDIVFVCDDDNEKYLTKAPKIIIEILSPSTAKKDETVKFNIYEDEKVKYYILVYPDDLRAKAYILKDGKYTKLGDFTKEKLVFDEIACDLEIDFDTVFRRFSR
ncbi:MAG TPA: Uma2 family endonuclease [Epsilonproteobacteria bacterium]|nr:Uma2 family endonuclease [Campylobacterota bacterium]